MYTVLVATDGSEAATHAVREAIEIARARSGKLIALYVVAHDDWRISRLGPLAEAVMTRLAESEYDTPLKEARRLALEAGVELEAVALSDEDRLTGILDAVASIRPDLLVVGSDGHGRILGIRRPGLAATLTRKARCDVFVVKPD